MNNQSFKGKSALVTGAAMGMGFAAAKAFAEAGAQVCLGDRNQDALAEAVRSLKAEGHTVLAVPCDVSSDEQVEALVSRAVAAFGSLDAAYNNAGVQCPVSDSADASGEDFDRTIAINLRGVWSSMKFELQQMRKQGSGAIVNCSSLGGLVGLPGRAIYHATKHGVIGLTKSAALEYAGRGIRINAVCPGTIHTPMVAEMLEKQKDALQQILSGVPMGRLGRAEEVANTVRWLCGEEASFITGQSIAIDGGYTMR